MRKNIVAGNWKMNKNAEETQQLIEELKTSLDGINPNGRVIITPTFVNLSSAVSATKESIIEVAAQNIHQAASGAFTGEISADMLMSVGVNTVILGHSERRTYFGEDDTLLKEKVSTALEKGMEVIFCFGELLEDRKANNHFNVVESQLKNVLFDLDADAWKHIVLAYEPVWAIGTGETASPEQAQEMHAFIRNLISEAYGEPVANEVSILYGGSVKPANAQEIFSKEDVDGGLIGGASLKADDFTEIIKAM
jgi:triosephosphate isomerase